MMRIAYACLLTLGLAVSSSVRGSPDSGIDRSAGDPSVRIQDDAFRAVNGRWLATTVIPPDRASTGPFERLADTAEQQLRAIIEGLSGPGRDAGGESRQIADLYASFMDEARVESAGLAPLRPTFARIDAIRTRDDLVRLMPRLDRIGVDVPVSVNVHQDAKDATRYIVDLSQGGIGLPDRDYFLATKDARFADVRAKYRVFLATLLTMAGEANAGAKANAVFALEAALARSQWSRVDNRDPVKTYNKLALVALPKLARHVDWTGYLEQAEIAGRTDALVISQPSFVRGFDRLVTTTPIETWKAYLKTRVLTAYAPYLDRAFVEARFAFVGTVLQGATENRARWKRGVQLVDQSIGEALGHLYVDRHFPPDDKARMDALVANLLAAFRTSIDTLDWMSPRTKLEAQAKLAAFTPKVGYPKRWRDYSSLEIKADDLVGNVERSHAFEYRRNLAKLGQPIDRDEWGMTPQTINAYYNAELNEVVFPAAILQPPFFDAQADDAVNYGAIGAVIGHEISHGFDDQGSQYDGAGNLRDWWTADDRKRFAAKAAQLVAQFDRYEPVPGYRVNGALTLGENIADLSGLAIAVKAYRLSLNGREAPIIDGLTGEQRLYIGFAQAWQEKTRDAAMVAQLKSDPHAPGEYRCNGTLSNQAGFDRAFGVEPGDRMYRAPDARVTIW